MPAAIAVTKAAVPNIQALINQLAAATAVLAALQATNNGTLNFSVQAGTAGTSTANGLPQFTVIYTPSAATIAAIEADLIALQTSINTTLAGYGITN